jgi:hypothetical protein
MNPSTSGKARTTISNGFVINSFVSTNILPSIYKIVIIVFELMTTRGNINHGDGNIVGQPIHMSFLNLNFMGTIEFIINVH